jgi:GTPase
MLPPEIEEGNKEYKRCFKEVNKKRFFELSTQMNWRLLEGNGEAFYYLSVNDDGTIYGKLDNTTFKYSINIIKKLAKECDAKITDIEEHKIEDLKWYKIKINKNNTKVLQEYRILLLGDTNTGKSTFLANIIKRKTNENNDANNYIYNHKHELESGNTSSIKYYTLVESDKKYLFFDSPGNSKYIKTLLKIVQSIDYNLVIYFPDENNKWEYRNIFLEYFVNILDTPVITLKLNSENNSFPNINLNELIELDKFTKYIYDQSIEIESENNDVNFIILNSCYNNEVGWLLSGYLKSGCINVGDVLLLYDNDSNIIKVKSIYCSNTEDITVNCKKINGPQNITLCCSIKDFENKEIKYGTISNKLYDLVDTVNIKWDFNINNSQINCNVLNKKLTLECIDNNKYKIINNKKILAMKKNTVFIDYVNKNIGFLV